MLSVTKVLGLLAVTVTSRSLVAATSSGYRTFNSSYGDHALRYKSWAADNTELCNGGSSHHAGWADLSDRHLFFWYHEARHDPASAPLLLWHQGGPGGSSLHGMLFENGPCLRDGPNATIYNRHSWTEYFNVVYLDQPAGVGFSYTDNDASGKPPVEHSRTPASSLDSVAFIKILYEAFPALSKVDLHLSGESYAGRYVPVLASSILAYNDFFDSSDDAIIPLRSIFVGNPYISPAIQLSSMHEVSCFPWRAIYPPHLDQPECQRLEASYQQCDSLFRACERGGTGSAICAMANTPCTQQIMGVFRSVNRSMYDRRLRSCDGPGNCYPSVTDTEVFLNAQRVFEGELEVTVQTGGAVKAWSMLNGAVFTRYGESGDMSEPTTPFIRELLTHPRQPIKVMFYVGVTDIICNPDGVLETLRNIDWPGKASFRGTNWRELPWKTPSGGRSGRVKGTSNLWLAELEEAGHMVPYDQPESSLRLVKRWLDHPDESSDGKNGGEIPHPGDQMILNEISRGLEL